MDSWESASNSLADFNIVSAFNQLVFMRRMFLIACLVFSTQCGNSQVIISLLLGDKLNTGTLEFGLEGGLNWSSLEGLADAKSLLGSTSAFISILS
jgi:hypothetical protein